MPHLTITTRTEQKQQREATDFLSPIRANAGIHHGSRSVRNSPMNVLSEAKADLQRAHGIIPKGQGLKNFTALELNRYIDKKLT